MRLLLVVVMVAAVWVWILGAMHRFSVNYCYCYYSNCSHEQLYNGHIVVWLAPAVFFDLCGAANSASWSETMTMATVDHPV